MKTYNQNAPAPVIVKELEQIFAQDKLVERKVKNYTIGIIIMAILFILSIIIFPYLLLAVIPLLIFFIVQGFRYHNQDLEDRKLLTGLKLARVIGVDLKKNSPL